MDKQEAAEQELSDAYIAVITTTYIEEVEHPLLSSRIGGCGRGYQSGTLLLHRPNVLIPDGGTGAWIHVRLTGDLGPGYLLLLLLILKCALNEIRHTHWGP